MIFSEKAIKYSIILWLFIVNLVLCYCLSLKCKASFPQYIQAFCYQKTSGFQLSQEQTQRLPSFHGEFLIWNSLKSLQACRFVHALLACPLDSFSSPFTDNLAAVLLPWRGGGVTAAGTVYWPFSLNETLC